ncbi:MAG: hypothetical protein JF611_07015 [Betaproteobacteria bacterium]|jgi:hypothetical protein|nr:hypothetical protein [Betaproteobacteria bacterium]
MTERRGLTVFFTDGTKMQLDYPKQAPNDIATLLKVKEILASRQLLVECDGVLLLFPFENIKYIEAHPAPRDLPGYTIKGATVAGATV